MPKLIFVTPFHCVRVLPLQSKKDAHFALDDFFHKVRIPHVMVSDGAKEQVDSSERSAAGLSAHCI